METRKSVLSIGNNICKGPEVEMNMAYMKNQEKANMDSRMGCNISNRTGEIEILAKRIDDP